MKKTLLCLFMALFILSSLCLCAFAESETPLAVDWYGSSTSVLSGYTFTVSNTTAIDPVPTAVSSWLTAVGAVSLDTAVGPFRCRTSSSNTDDFMIFLDGSTIRNTNRDKLTQIYSGSYTVDSLDGYDYAVAIGGNTSVTDVYTTADGGFVTSGFLSSLGIVGSVLGFLLGSPLLAFIGLSVGVFLIGWGITSVKDLIKGY